MTPTASRRPAAQIVIATHSTDRPVRRAVESVLKCSSAGVIVVAHGINADELDLPKDARVKVVEVGDRVGFPGVPFNAGVQSATAPWVGVMGSDDWFEDGALEAMLRRAESDCADGVLAPRRRDYMASNILVPATPRRRNLSASRDGLFQRVAPLGLFRTEMMQRPDHAFDERTHSGEDLPVSTRLWTEGNRVSYYPADPAYVEGTDARERTSTIARPLAQHVPIWLTLWDTELVRGLSQREVEDLAERSFHGNVLPLLHKRPQPEDWPTGDFEWLTAVVRRMTEAAPGFGRSFTRARQRTYEGLLEGDLAATLEAQRLASYLDWRLLAHPIEVFHRNTWWRKRARSYLAKVRFDREAETQSQLADPGA